MHCNNSIGATGIICLVFGIFFCIHFFLYIPDYNDSNPFIGETYKDLYHYFNINNATKECEEIKVKLFNKTTLSEIFPIDLDHFILIAIAIKWITLIICIYIFVNLILKELLFYLNNIIFYCEIIIGLILLLLDLILNDIGDKTIMKYSNFLECENVNRNSFDKYKEMNALPLLLPGVLFYIFFLFSYFGFIVNRNYQLKNNYYSFEFD